MSVNPSNCADLDIVKNYMNRIISMEDIDKRIQGALAIRVSVYWIKG